MTLGRPDAIVARKDSETGTLRQPSSRSLAVAQSQSRPTGGRRPFPLYNLAPTRFHPPAHDPCGRSDEIDRPIPSKQIYGEASQKKVAAKVPRATEVSLGDECCRRSTP
jgi:hypothetical protein